MTDTQPTNITLEDIYGQLDMRDEEFEARVDRSLGPRGVDMLYDRIAALGVAAGHRLLDIGCRDARHAIRLAARFGCAVVGVDPVAYQIGRAQAAIAAAGLGQLVIALEGQIEAIPADDASFDFIWCRDMLNHVPNLRAGLAECARVLRPGGAMLVYQTFATDLLEPREAAWLYESLAILPANMDTDHFERACAAAGLRVAEHDPIASEWRERWEEDGSRITSGQLLRIARMRRDRARLVADLGEKPYQVELANCTWGVYQLLGKLCPTLYVLERPPAAPAPTRP